jgi:hypothetical protein
MSVSAAALAGADFINARSASCAQAAGAAPNVSSAKQESAQAAAALRKLPDKNRALIRGRSGNGVW